MGTCHYFGLPRPVVEEALERDRSTLGLGRVEDYQYVPFRRDEVVTKDGPGFDKPGVDRKGK